jgi:hypothetical protein
MSFVNCTGKRRTALGVDRGKSRQLGLITKHRAHVALSGIGSHITQTSADSHRTPNSH